MTFEPGLAEALAAGDANYLSVLDEADAWVARNGARPAGGAGGAGHAARSAVRDRPDPRARPRRGRDHGDRLGDRLCARLRLAEGRRLRRDGGRGTSAASRPSPGSISSGCPGSRGAGRPSSGACGTTRSSSPTISPSSAPISPTRVRAARQRRRLSRADPTEKPMAHNRIRPFNTRETYPEQNLDNDLCPGRRRPRRDDLLAARPVPAGPRHRAEHRQPRPGRADAQGDAEHPAADRGGGRDDGAPGEGRRLPDRRPPPRGGLPHDGRVYPRRASGLDRPGGARRWRGPNGWSRSTAPP